MARDHQHNPDPNENAASAVGRATAAGDQATGDLEAAWAAWSSHLQKVDKRSMTLLRAAFEAGYAAASSAAPVALGRLGGLKGGNARKNALSPKKRSEIAKKAAKSRWAGKEKQDQQGESS